MMDIQEISDRLEIQDLITKYCTSVDSKSWEDYRALFLKNASIEHSKNMFYLILKNEGGKTTVAALPISRILYIMNVT